MPPRKYPDLAHLSPEEYKIESEKRRTAERKEYLHQQYIKNREKRLTASKLRYYKQFTEETVKEKLEEKLANTLDFIEKVKETSAVE